jgi:hypothetical protein
LNEITNLLNFIRISNSPGYDCLYSDWTIFDGRKNGLANCRANTSRRAAIKTLVFADLTFGEWLFV